MMDLLADFLTEEAYAAMRGVSLRTVMRERSLREGPPFIKLGRKIYYRRQALEQWLLSKETNPQALTDDEMADLRTKGREKARHYRNRRAGHEAAGSVMGSVLKLNNLGKGKGND